MPASPRVSVVIPSWGGRVEALLASIRAQTLQPLDLHVIERVAPSGRARNQGVARARGDLILFVDDDAVLGHDHVIEQLAAPFARPGAEDLAVTGTSKILPPDAGWFQRWAAREIPRVVHPVSTVDVPSSPRIDGYGFSEVTTTCCIVRRRVFDEVGGFHEELHRGVDTEFFFQVARKGHRFLLVANSWVYHPAPRTLRELCAKFWAMGVWHAQEARLNPERGIGPRLTPLAALAYLALRTAILVPNVFVPRSRAYPHWELSVKPLKAFASYVNAWGYAYGSAFLRTPPREASATPAPAAATRPANGLVVPVAPASTGSGA